MLMAMLANALFFKGFQLTKVVGSISLRPRKFVSDVLSGLPIHEGNTNIPIAFRQQIPAITAQFKRLESIEKEVELAAELRTLMHKVHDKMDALDVEGQIYLNMLYQVSTYNNMAYDLSSEFRRCLSLLRIDMKRDGFDIDSISKFFAEFKEDKNSELTLGSQVAMKIMTKGIAGIERN